ncbi:hypothetical protein [Qipengyuania sp. RANM35]|uniref:hypothetical protein n=1 Tax=Qipengyuania sp. RANM35 TaxID=3068635 RepID=UPI0034DAECA0
MKRSVFVAGVALAALTTGWAIPAMTQSAASPARYTMDARTMSGMAAMGGGGGMAAAMAMMQGKGGGAAHELHLKLGSGQAPTGTAKADHFMPSGAGLGASVPLTYTPGKGEVGPAGTATPKGKLLLFWGCGEHAPPGQPVVIDFSKLAKGQVPPDLYAAAVNIPEEWRIMPSNSRTYGEWPNGLETKAVPPKSSLIGAHRIASTYAPEISFSLDQDFMAPVEVKSSRMPSGAWDMRWQGVGGATGYYAWVMSAKEGPGREASEMVWWTSSANRAFGGPMWDWLSPAAAAKLVAAKTVMAPSQTSCTVPAEVQKAGGEMMMANLSAYGPERNFSYPPRPPKAAAGWKPDWIARVRYRSTNMSVLGMEMPDTGQMSDSEASEAAPKPASKPKCKGLKGIAMRAAGLCE